MKNILKKSGAILIITLLPSTVLAEIKVIVNPSVVDTSITENQLTDIFLGKLATLPGGQKIIPVDQASDEKLRNEFYAKVAKKDPSQLNAYWARLIFTGKGQPPKMLAGNAEVLQKVLSNPDTIGYVSGSVNTSGVKVLLVLH